MKTKHTWKVVVVLAAIILFLVITIGSINTQHQHLATNQNNSKVIPQYSQKCDSGSDSKVNLKNSDQFQGITIKAEFQDRDDNLWIGTNEGLWSKDVDDSIFVKNKQIFTGANVQVNVFFQQDKSENLWLGTNRGLWEKKGEGKDFNCVTPSLQDYSVSVNTILVDHIGNWWLGTNQGVYEKKNNTKNYIQYVDSNLIGVSIFVEDQFNNIWLGTMEKGLWEKKAAESTFQQYDRKIVSHGESVDVIKSSKNGDLFLAAPLSGLQVKKVGSDSFTKNQQLPIESSIKSIFQDSQNNLWVGTENNSLWERKANDSVFKQVDPKLIKGWINIIFEDKEGNIWIAIISNGLWEKQAKSNTFNQNKQIKSQSVNRLLEDNDGNFWIAVFVASGTKTSGLWIKQEKGIFINWKSSTNNTSSYFVEPKAEGEVEGDIIFGNDFTITVRDANIHAVYINNKKVIPAPLDNPITFPNSKYGAKSNQKIHFEVRYKNQKGLVDTQISYERNFIIKSHYNDDCKGKQDNIKNAITTSDGAKLEDNQVYIKGSTDKVKYELVSVLSTISNSKPSLIIDSGKLNFLTDWAKSNYASFTFTGAVIWPYGVKTYLQKDKKFTIVDSPKGPNSDTLYQVQLQDKVGNKEEFLLQVGGNKLDQHFLPVSPPPPLPPTPPLNKHTVLTVIGSIVSAFVALLILLAIFIFVYRPFVRKRQLITNKLEKKLSVKQKSLKSKSVKKLTRAEKKK